MNSITIDNNNYLTITGATKVVSSTQSQAVVEQGSETIIINGSELEVKKLDLDGKEVSIAGRISNLKFTSKAEKVPLMKRIFK